MSAPQPQPIRNTAGITPALLDVIAADPELAPYMRVGFQRRKLCVFVGRYGEDFAEVECVHLVEEEFPYLDGPYGAKACARTLADEDRLDRKWKD